MKFYIAPNPVLVKELRGRMRGARAYVFLTVTLLLMGVVSYALYRVVLALFLSSSGGPAPSAAGALLGQCIFAGLIALALLFICMVAPALTAGAISSEHDRKTFDLLVATPLASTTIISGKLMAALSYVALVVLSAIPLVSMSYVFGGVTVRDMLKALMLLLEFALAYGLIGLFFSTWFRRTGTAAVISYVVVIGLVVGTAIIYGFDYYMWINNESRNGNFPLTSPPSRWWLLANPIAALFSALWGLWPTRLSNEAWIPWAFLSGSLDVDVDKKSVLILTPMWRYTVCFYAWLSGLLYLASAYWLRPAPRSHWRAPGCWVLIAYVIGSIVLSPLVYWLLTRAPYAVLIRP